MRISIKPIDGTDPLTKPIILSKLSKPGLSQCVFPKGCDIQSHRCVEHVQLDEVKTFEVAHGRPTTKSSVAGKSKHIYIIYWGIPKPPSMIIYGGILWISMV